MITPKGSSSTSRVTSRSPTGITLAMSRSIGDLSLRGAGVVARPSVRRQRDLQDGDCIVACSDGVWEFLSDDKVGRLVELSRQQQHADMRDCCIQLVTKAVEQWTANGAYRDDITVLMVSLPVAEGPGANADLKHSKKVSPAFS